MEIENNQIKDKIILLALNILEILFDEDKLDYANIYNTDFYSILIK